MRRHRQEAITREAHLSLAVDRRVPRRSRATAALESEAWEVVAELQPEEDDAAMRAEIVARLQLHVDSVVPGGILRLFGSSSCGLNAKGADIDLTIEHPAGPNVAHDTSKAVVMELGGILGCRGAWANVEAITASRVPIVQLEDRASGLKIDISVGNQLARLKTLLLGSYAQLDTRARALCFVVKRWAHVRKINEPKAKTPNSYTWAQMVVSYLQQSEPPLLPCVQALGGGAWTDAWSSDVDGSLPSDDLMLLVETEAAARAAPRVAELRADFDAVQAATAAAHADAAGVVLGQLLPGFFSFWLDYFDGKRQTAVVSVRHGRLLGLSEKVWANDEYDAERPLIGLEDPVEVAHNLGRVLTTRTLATVRSELERARDTLAAGQPLRRVLEWA